MKVCLTIAGSDPSGGAGIQADLKTFCMNGVYGQSVITALTVQNTTGVKECKALSPLFFKRQLECVLSDIQSDSVKIGMTCNSSLISIIASSIKKYNLKNVVTDPVLISTSGKPLVNKKGIKALTQKLFPLSTLITPNLDEAEFLSGIKIQNQKDTENAAVLLNKKYGCNVLIKGGHSKNNCNDYLYYKDKNILKGEWFNSQRIENKNTHGTGCTLSSAISANLAKGLTLPQSIFKAKQYITQAISASLDLGQGRGPLMHNFIFKDEK